jgi:hypothetical protein
VIRKEMMMGIQRESVISMMTESLLRNEVNLFSRWRPHLAQQKRKKQNEKKTDVSEWL